MLPVFVMKLKEVEEKLWKSGSIQIDVLEKDEKKNQIKRQNRKKNDKSNKKSVHPGAKRNGNWTRILTNLSQLFGA